MDICIKRVYETAQQTDGMRVLVDRLWPRGMKNDEAQLDMWAKGLAPSTQTRKEFNHQPEKFTEFAHKYEAELDKRDEVKEFLEQLRNENPQRLTLLYGAKDQEHNHAIVLQKYLQKHLKNASLATSQ